MFETGEVFLDWLAKSGQSAWQLLPLSETQLEPGSKDIHVPSPYKGYGIGLDPKHLSDEAKNVYPNDTQLEAFQKKHNDWIFDYALFCALRDYFETDDWSLWDDEIQKRNSKIIEQFKEKLATEIQKYITEQWQAHLSYLSFREKAKAKNIFLIGDIPFYIGFKSPLVWANQDVFDLAKDRSMRKISGSLQRSNAYFGRQVWGHPLYVWNNPSSFAKILTLWKTRLSYSGGLFDIVRLDHAIGFFHYGSLDPNDPSLDEKKPGPGFAAFSELVNFTRAIGLAIYVEDAAVELKELRHAMKALRIGGVRIFRFALNERRNIIEPDYAYPARYPAKTCAYTSLHDTEPLMGYIKILTSKQKKLLAKTANVTYSQNDKELAVRFRQAVIDSPAQSVIIPIQDWLLTEDRINIPGTEREKGDPNWHYQLAAPVEQLPTHVNT